MLKERECSKMSIRGLLVVPTPDKKKKKKKKNPDKVVCKLRDTEKEI